MSRERKRETSEQLRATLPTTTGLFLAVPAAFAVTAGLYYGLEGHWGTAEQRVILAGGVLFVILSCLNWQFGVRPVKVLLEGVEQLSRSNFRFRFTVGTEDEFGRIAREFNRLLGALDRAGAEVESLRKALRGREEGETGGTTRSVELLQEAMQRFSREIEPDLLAESALQTFFRDLRADRCMVIACHEAANILSLEAIGQDPGQRISEKLHLAVFPKSEEELLALGGWPALDRARQWLGDPSLHVLGQIMDTEGTLLGYVAAFREIRWPFTDNDRTLFAALVRNLAAALQNLRLHQRSVTDGLTGLYTRRLMEEVLDREAAKAKRTGLPLTLLMMDVNNFKRVNDELGHAAGDDLLRRIADAVKGCVRSADYHPCRYGGDEFLVLLAATNLEGALGVGERILKEVGGMEQLPRLSNGKTVSVAIGAACYPTHGTTIKEVMASADKAMYEAKRQGGNALKEADRVEDEEQ